MSLPKVLTANRAKLDQEAMKERNAQFWPISALRILLKCKENPEVSENSMWCDVFLKSKRMVSCWTPSFRTTLWFRRCLDIARSTRKKRLGTSTSEFFAELISNNNGVSIQEIPGRLHSGWLWSWRHLHPGGGVVLYQFQFGASQSEMV